VSALGPGPQARCRLWLGCVLAALGVFAIPAAAAAAPAYVSVGNLEPSLEKHESGNSSVAISVTNQTDMEIGLGAAAKGATGCQLGFDKTKLPAATTSTVTVLMPAGCKPADPLKLELTATTDDGATQVLELTPKQDSAKKPDWNQLWAFGWAFLFSALFLTSLFFGGWRPKEEGRRRPGQRLSSLEATWKFNDNWATNVTTVGALLTGLFGATTAKAFLGEEAESLVALATTGAAIALVFVSAAPILALAMKSYRVKDEKTEKKVRGPESFTVAGVLLAALFVLTGAGGQLWVAAYTFSELSLGDAEILAWIAFGFGVLVLALYTWRTLRNTLEQGTDDPEVTPIPDEIKAAERIATAIENHGKSGEERKSARAAWKEQLSATRASRPRSALI
jgi:hypothetical protein